MAGLVGLLHQHPDVAGFPLALDLIGRSRSSGQHGDLRPRRCIVGYFDLSLPGFANPAELDVVEFGFRAEVDVYPLFSAFRTHPRAVEAFGREHCDSRPALVLKLYFGKRPVSCPFHPEPEAEEGKGFVGIQLERRVQLPCGERPNVSVAFVRVCGSFRIGRFTGQSPPAQPSDTFPVLTVDGDEGVDFIAVYGRFRLIGHAALELQALAPERLLRPVIFEVGVFALEVVPREGAAVDRPFPFALWQRAFGRADDKAVRLVGRDDAVRNQLSRQIVIVTR